MCGFLFSIPYVFGIYFVSIIASKLLHLFTHLFTVPLPAFLLYLPTFFIFDFLAICIVRLLLTQSKTPWARLGCMVGSIATLISIGGSASQLGFFVSTGGELDWSDAAAYTTNKDGLKVLLSGSTAVIGCGIVLLVVAIPIHGFVYRAFGAFLCAAAALLLSVYTFVVDLVARVTHGERGSRYAALEAQLESRDTYSMEEDLRSNNTDDSCFRIQDGEKNSTSERSTAILRFLPWMWKIAVALFLTLTLMLRPTKPYDFLSVTLPVSMLDAFGVSGPDFCHDPHSDIANHVYPFPELIQPSEWKRPDDKYFKGWAPLTDKKLSPLAEKYRKRTVDWLPKDEELPRGFFRFDPKRFINGFYGSHATNHTTNVTSTDTCADAEFAAKDPYYNPVSDPLKITNLDQDILPTLKDALGNGDVKIKHVFFILMESLRADFWPLQEGSHTHSLIMDLNKSDQEKKEANELLSWLSPHIEQITGVSQGFTDLNDNPSSKPNYTWHDTAEEGFGGINIAGAYTTATMSTKSYGANHCGAYPMAVEKFAEADVDSYQPCMPQILSLLNKVKNGSSSRQVPSKDFRDWNWRTGLFEAEVEEYDRQEIFDAKLGFDHIITRRQLEEDWRFNASDIMYQKVNYFAYPEPVILPYLREFIGNSTANNERMWMSHFTSSTHHTWGLPEGYPYYDYVPHTGINNNHDYFNRYINTIRWHDGWMATLMNLLEEYGIANETLVVFAGDHGYSFKSDGGKDGTYENEHVSNYRVGLTFRHPHLPRVQYDANATTASILPTILDLLINSGSLNEKDTHIASDLVQDYEGQSLIRPYKKNDGDRRAWSFTVVNSGAGMLGVTSADVPWRLTMPLNKVLEYRVTDAVADPQELAPVSAWSPEELEEAARYELGLEAAQWIAEAIPTARWWVKERQRLWRY
ncbi:hypothetical protein NLU13_5562 [Sarocladium strictum]|uniref:Sulfatase N-terminal domain-containing protein n=1 Tax=Sarocladium strictum TaxID=5046 RepID=A0AA39GIS2_SARSR|nr:hypothetical protein NLU13_5562 [Sarocladium strictum]